MIRHDDAGGSRGNEADALDARNLADRPRRFLRLFCLHQPSLLRDLSQRELHFARDCSIDIRSFLNVRGRIGSAFVASFVTNRVFGGAVGGMRAGLMVVAVLGVALALLPNSQDFVWVAMALLVPLFS